MENPINNSGPLVNKIVKKEGDDWVIIYNPAVSDKININFVNNFDHQSVVCCVNFSRDGKYLATGSNKVTQIFDLEKNKVVREFRTFKNSISSPRMDSNSQTSISNSSSQSNSMNGTFSESENQSGNSNEAKEDTFVRSVCFSPDGLYLAAGAEDKTVKVWSISNGNLKHSFSGHELDIIH
jgi:glucose repression regulatory protein TUP1